MKKVLYIVMSLLFAIAGKTDLKAQDSFSVPQLLVTTDWLEENLSRPDLVILHYGDVAGYYKEHIPGARQVAMERLLIEGTNGLTHELPEQSALESILRSWGINEDSQIVLYYADKYGLIMASRILLTLDYAGLEGRIALLNGGLPDWKAEDKELTNEVPDIQEGDVNINVNSDMLADRGYILDHMGNDTMRLVDARPERMFSGKTRDQNASRRGHIKGAVNIPFDSVTSEEASHRFKSKAEIRELFDTHFIGPDSRIITYCGSGIWASPVYIAARWLGYDVGFYDGSFQEWGNDDSLPVISDQ